MPWYFYAFITAAAYGLEGVLVKHFHNRNFSEKPLLFAAFFYSVPFLIPLAGLHSRTIAVSGRFLFYLLLVGIGNSIGFYFYSKSIKNTEVSVAVPVLSISPVFVVPFSLLLLGERIPAVGMAGIGMVILGLFFLSWDPFRSMTLFFNHKGVRYAFLTALIWGVVANLDKLALNLSHPLVYPLLMAVTITGILAPFGARKEIFDRRFFLPLLGLGFIHSILLTSHMLALQTGYVACVIAIKRSGMLVSIFLGWKIFKEEKPGAKFLAAAFLLLGIYLIVR